MSATTAMTVARAPREATHSLYELDEFSATWICSPTENHVRQSRIRSSSESYAPHCSKKGRTDDRYWHSAVVRR
jgi:hypothetical protein